MGRSLELAGFGGDCLRRLMLGAHGAVSTFARQVCCGVVGLPASFQNVVVRGQTRLMHLALALLCPQVYKLADGRGAAVVAPTLMPGTCHVPRVTCP